MSFSFKRSFSSIVLSSAGAQLLMLLSMPALTRLYSKTEFGEFGIFVVYALLVSNLMSARLEYSAHEPHADADAVANAALIVASLSTLLCSGLLLAIGFLARLNDLELPAFSYWQVIMHGFGWALTNVVLIHANFHGHYRLIAWMNLLPPLLFVIIALLASRVPALHNGLITGQSVGYLLTGFVGILLARGIPRRVSPAALWQTVNAARGNIVYLVPSSIMSVISVNLMIIGSSLLYSSQTVGLIVVCQRLVRAPVALVTRPFGEILRNSFSTPDAALPTFHRILWLSIGLALCSIAGVLLLPESFFTFLLGSEWIGMKSILLVLMVAACSQILGSWVNPVYVCYCKHHELGFQLLLVLAGGMALGMAATLSLDPLSYLGLHVVSVSAIYVLSLFNAKRILLQVGTLPSLQATARA